MTLIALCRECDEWIAGVCPQQDHHTTEAQPFEAVLLNRLERLIVAVDEIGQNTR